MAAMADLCGLVDGQNLPEKAKGHCSRAGFLLRRTGSRSISRAKESTVGHYLLGLAGRRIGLSPHVTGALAGDAVLSWAELSHSTHFVLPSPRPFPKQDFRPKSPLQVPLQWSQRKNHGTGP